MTTYRKDAKEQHHSPHYAPVDMHKVQSELWARTSCLLGFTVISILIGCVALAISILLLLQSFDLAGIENAKVADLEMRIKYLEYLTENMQQEEEYHVDIPDTKAAPPPPPSPLPQTPPPPPPPPPTIPPPPPTQPAAPTHPRTPGSRNHGGTIPEIPNPEENEEPGDTDRGTVVNGPPRPPVDDDDSDGWLEGSGDEVDCPRNPPRPICPMGMRLCTTKERCPKYVCCKG